MLLLRIGLDFSLLSRSFTPCEGCGEGTAWDGGEGGAPREGEGGAAEDHFGGYMSVEAVSTDGEVDGQSTLQR